MTNASTQSADIKLMSDHELRYAKAIFVAIEALSGRKGMGDTVAALAGCGKWVIEGSEAAAEYLESEVIAKYRGGVR